MRRLFNLQSNLDQTSTEPCWFKNNFKIHELILSVCVKLDRLKPPKKIHKKFPCSRLTFNIAFNLTFSLTLSDKSLSISFATFCTCTQSFRRDSRAQTAWTCFNDFNIKCIAVKAEINHLYWDERRIGDTRFCWYVKLWSSSLGINFLYYSFTLSEKKPQQQKTKISRAKQRETKKKLFNWSHRVWWQLEVSIWFKVNYRLIFRIRWKSMSAYCARSWNFTFILLIVSKPQIKKRAKSDVRDSVGKVKYDLEAKNQRLWSDRKKIYWITITPLSESLSICKYLSNLNKIIF